LRGFGLLLLALLGAAIAWPSLAPHRVERVGETRAAPGTTATAPAVEGGWNRIVVPPGPHGHFSLTARVDGVPVDFLIDTGASAVVLSPDDARRIGLLPGRLRFTRRVATANGIVRAAPVTLRELRIGQLALWGLEAFVIEAPMPVSLLGTSFLARLASWSVEGGRLHLYW
jgi:aspartyl protease family protein